MDKKTDYLKTEYAMGLDAIKMWLNSRYQMFQMTSYVNLGALTFGSQLGLLFSEPQKIAGILITITCLLVTLIGLATEISTRSYNSAYYKMLRDIEKELNQIDGRKKGILDEIGIFSSGRKSNQASYISRFLSAGKLHIVFYVFLCVLWIVSLIFHIALI